MPQPNTVWDGIFQRDGAVFADPHEDLPRLLDLLRSLFSQFETVDLHLDRDAHYCLTALRAPAESRSVS